jgi:chemotaxis protein methyltransferase CheR
LTGSDHAVLQTTDKETAALAGIAEIVRVEAGLSIRPPMASMLKARLAPRLRRLGMADFRTYLNFLEGDKNPEEREELVTALTTNISHFFREPHHFDLLRHEILPPLVQQAKTGAPVRLWSAGCAAGQEPYSIAMTVLELMPDAADHDVKILATDVDAKILAKAQRGVFCAKSLQEIPAPLHARFLRPKGAALEVTNAVRQPVRFCQHNLHDPWPMRAKFDVIFCRNVLIYFEPEAQMRLIARFAAALKPQGWLFLGHSERIPVSGCAGFCTAGVTAYRRAPIANGGPQ